MTQDKYEYYIKKTKEDFKELVDETQSKLDKSKSKSRDYQILCTFWNKLIIRAIDKWEDTSCLFLDDEAILPMPESVSKQFCNMLFSIKNLDVLTDLDIDEGFE